MLTKLPFDEQFSFSITPLREWGWEGERRGDKRAQRALDIGT